MPLEIVIEIERPKSFFLLKLFYNEFLSYFHRNLTNVSPIELYHELTYSITEMVEKITIYTMTADTLGSYKLVLNKQNLERNVIPGYHRSLGRCHTLSLQEAIRQRGIRYIELKM